MQDFRPICRKAQARFIKLFLQLAFAISPKLFTVPSKDVIFQGFARVMTRVAFTVVVPMFGIEPGPIALRVGTCVEFPNLAGF